MTERRTAMVTGGNRGLGFATAQALAREGYEVLVSARSADKARDAEVRFREAGLEVAALIADLREQSAVDALFEQVDARFSRLDVLVNNAGAMLEPHGARAGSLPAGTLAEAFDNNTLSAYRTSQHALRRMNEAGYGRIVNVSSGLGALTEMGTGTPAYRVSKAALNAVTRLFHGEAEGNVKVNSVCPGWVRTDLGGSRATRSIEEGIKGIVWAAMLGEDGPSGGFFRDGEPIDW